MDSTYEPPSGISKTGRRILAGVAALAVAASAAVTGIGLRDANAAESEAASAAGSSAINGFRSVGYFAQWGVYGRGYQVKQIDTSGVADELTHINYAFANIHHQNIE